jgi:hypothetical protein
MLRFGWYDHYCIIYETVNNYAFERTVMWRRNVRRDRAAAQRGR